MVNDWYKDFFRGIALDLWRQACSPEQTQAEVDMLSDLLGISPGDRVLDVPCGLGRHLTLLAEAGYLMTGVDYSVEALQETATNLQEKGLSAQLVRRDMKDLEWEETFDAAFCLGNSFGYFDAASTQSFLTNLAGSLRSGGRFLLDSGMVAECVLPNFDERNWYQVGEILMLIEHAYCAVESRLDTTYSFIRGGKRVTRIGSHYLFTSGEICRFLTRAGLVPERLLSTAGEAFDIASPGLLVLAVKEDSTEP